MKKIAFLLLCGAVCCLMVIFESCKKDEYNDLDCSSINASYANDIKPLIQANCINSGCHNAKSSNGDFTEYNGLKGKANNGSLNKRVLETKDMPSSGTLSLNDRKKIKCWLENAAPAN